MVTFFSFTFLIISKQLFVCVQLMLNMAYEQVDKLQSVSWILAEFRHNKIVQLPRENCFNVCRQLQRKVRSRKHDV